MNTVNYGADEYGVEDGQLAQRLRLAQMLTQQGMDTGPVYSNKAGIAKALLQALGGYEQGQAEKGQRELAGRRESARKSEIDAIFAATQPAQPYVGGGQVQKDDDGNAMPGTSAGPAGAATPAGRMQLAKLLAGSADPQLRQTGLALMMKGPEKPEAFTLKPGERRYEGDRVVAEVPESQKQDGPKRGALRSITKGNVEEQQEFDGTSWVKVGEGPRWQPHQAPQPDRSLVEVQDPANPLKTILVPRDQAAGKAGAQSVTGARQSRGDLDGLRKEFNALPAVKTFNDVRPIVESAKKAPDTPQGDFALIYGVGKVLDPNSVVREGEMNMVIASGSPAQRVQGYLAQLQGKGRLTPDMRKELVGILETRAGEYEKQYQAARSTYEGIAKQRGHESSQIFVNPPGAPPTVRSDADFDALPSGAVFVDPNGKTRRKP